jgi:hypothetical protein
LLRSYHNAAASSRPRDPMPGCSDIAGRSALSATSASVIHSNRLDRVAFACRHPFESRYNDRGSGWVPNKKRIRNKGAGGNAGLLMAIVTCAIIDLVAIALFFGLCIFVCP